VEKGFGVIIDGVIIEKGIRHFVEITRTRIMLAIENEEIALVISNACPLYVRFYCGYRSDPLSVSPPLATPRANVLADFFDP
jgi:hypothetical protein